MRLLLTRHGESEANRNQIYQGHMDSPLSEEGRKQTFDLVKRLMYEKVQFSKIYASDLTRASETAKIINATFHMPIVFTSNLRELDLGIFAGKNISELKVNGKDPLQEFFKNPHMIIPKGESLNHMKLRIKSFLDMIKSLNTFNTSLLIVAHGGVLFHIIKQLNIPFESPKGTWFENCKLQELEQSHDGIWRIIRYNENKF